MPYEKVGKNEPICIADEVPFDIPESWEWVRLKDIVVKEIKRGKSPTYADNSSILVFAQKCNTKAGIIDLSPAKHLDFKSFAKYLDDEYMQDGDIVVNSTGNGTLGRVGVFHDADRSNDCVIVPDSHVTTIRINKILVLDYVYYVLVYYQPYFEKNCSGSTNQTELKPLVIANLFIPVPPIEEQRRIIRKLSSVLPLVTKYDEKEAALEVYNTAFPAQLKKSILQYAVQGKLVPQDPAESGIPIVNPANIIHGNISSEKIKKVSNATANRLSSYKLKAFDIIIGRRGEMGRSAVVESHQEGWLCGTGCFFVTPSKLLLPQYLVFLLNSPFVKAALTENSVGTTMNNLNHNILQSLLIPVPPINEQKKIMTNYQKSTAILDG